jgi:DnaK suppressor protein
VSKSPANKTPAKSKVAGKVVSRQPAAKPTPPKPAAKPTKPAAKPVAKPLAKPTAKQVATKAPSKPVVKPAPGPAAPKQAAAKPLKKTITVPQPPARPIVTKPPVTKAASKPTPAAVASLGATLKTTLPMPPAAPIPLPKTNDKSPAGLAAAAAHSRFTERFAPPRPPQRVLPELLAPVRPVIKADPRLANAWKNKAGRDLSEDELLAMPEAEYMNEKQLEFFRVQLQALKDDLLSNAGETTEHLREDTSIVPDPADRATIEEEHALELRTRDRERKLLKKISQSLGRIEAGDYGYCDETGEPIGLGRLLARPTATLSLEAQQRRELKQKMFGD